MNPTITCQNMAPFAKKVYVATGALVDGKPLICGGYYTGGNYYDECYMITKSSTSYVSKMKSKRAYAASVLVNINKLWVLGGKDDGSSYLSSTEYIQIGIGSSTGPHLPLAVGYHAMVALNTSTFILIGGYSSGYLSKTFYFQESNQDWIPGPEMDTARYRHAAGVGIDTATSQHYIAVTGGENYYGELDSVEILYSGETEWQTGKQRATTRPHIKVTT